MKALVRNSTGKGNSVKRSGPLSEPPDSENCFLLRSQEAQIGTNRKTLCMHHDICMTDISQLCHDVFVEVLGSGVVETHPRKEDVRAPKRAPKKQSVQQKLW